MSIKVIFPIHKWDFRNESILADLPSADLLLLTANKTEKLHKKGEIIFREGSFPSGIFSVADGRVKKYKLDKDGREHIIYVANTGELLGYHAILAEDDSFTEKSLDCNIVPSAKINVPSSIIT